LQRAIFYLNSIITVFYIFIRKMGQREYLKIQK
jgi:hypothetical protein